MRGWHALALALMVAAPLLAAPAHADHTMLVCFPGGPGSTTDASERLRAFFARLQEVSGLQVKGEYHNTREACDRYIKDRSPTIAMFPYAELVAWHEALKLVPVAQVTRQGRGDNRYYVVAKKGTALDALKGKALMTAVGADLPVISKVGFGAKLDVEAHFQVKPVATALKAIKALAKGEVDAALLDANEYKSLQSLPNASELEAVATSDPLPGAPVVVMGEGAAIAGKLREALPKVCEDAKACEAIEVERIAPADLSAFQAILSLGK